MKLNFLYLLAVVILTSSACTADGNSSDQGATTETTKTVEEKKPSQNLTKPDCKIAGTFLEGNEIWLKEENRLLYILADSTTADHAMEESHRILEVYNTTNCQLMDRKTLPVNVSTDFPYYIADINYNNISHLVAIKGYQSIYCYNIKTGRLLEKLEAQFKKERMATDAQSGMIQRLEVWENYLIGYAVDYGSFVFKLNGEQKPEAVLASAEFELSESNFNTLFLLESSAGNYQAILPGYDFEAEQFEINPLFQTAKKIDPKIPNSIQDNRFLVLKEALTGGELSPLVIDMKTSQLVELPNDIETAKTQDILKWVKEKAQ